MDQTIEITPNGFLKMPPRPRQPTEREQKETVDNLHSIADALKRNIAHIERMGGGGKGKKSAEERRVARENNEMDYCLGQMAKGKTWEEAKAMYDSNV